MEKSEKKTLHGVRYEVREEINCNFYPSKKNKSTMSKKKKLWKEKCSRSENRLHMEIPERDRSGPETFCKIVVKICLPVDMRMEKVKDKLFWIETHFLVGVLRQKKNRSSTNSIARKQTNRATLKTEAVAV